MASSDKFPGSATYTGTERWWNPENITADDGSYSRCSVPLGDYGGYLIGYNFGFSIPTGATINGIKVEVEGHVSEYNKIYLADISLGSWDDSSFTQNGDTKHDTTKWGQNWTVFTYGSSTDTWNATLNRTVVNDSKFAVSIRMYNTYNHDVTAYVDYVKITVYYTTPSIAKIMGVAKANISKVNGVSVSSISKIMGVTP